MSIPSAYKGFRVVIAGGGLGGLTLANALERAGIDYVLLEARDVIDPAVGASMGIMPNGSRILDQLDCFDDILDLTYPIQSSGNHTGSGKLIHPRLDSPLLGFKRSECILSQLATAMINLMQDWLRSCLSESPIGSSSSLQTLERQEQDPDR